MRTRCTLPFVHIRKSHPSSHESWDGKHRYEHWHVDNQVYFITARCRDRAPAFASDDAKQIFWDRFDHWTRAYDFVPWITTLIDNHYHTLGYNRHADNLGPMMRRIHGSVAKLVNDTLGVRLVPFGCDRTHHDYFDGCIRDELQARRAYRYTLAQCRRHGICADPSKYPHTRIAIDIDRAVRRAKELNAFLEGVPYKRYQR